MKKSSDIKKFPVKRVLLGLILSAIILWLVFSKIDLGLVLEKILTINPMYYGLALFAFFLTYPLRTIRWKTLLSAQGYKIRFSPLFKIICFTWFFNSISPSKFGEAYRIWSAKKLDVSRSKIIALILLERFFDLVIIIILSFFFVYSAKITQPLITSALNMSLLFVIAGSFFLTLMLRKPSFAKKFMKSVFSLPLLSRFSEKFEHAWEKFQQGFRIFKNKKKIFNIFILTVTIWMLEIVSLAFVVQAFGITLNFYFLGFLAILTALITALPLTPGGLGIAEGALIMLFTYQGISGDVGTGISILFRFATLYVTILVGALLLPIINPAKIEK
ncbi:MAG: flippase-like domain-containing protein [Nanoarchaeota archaeon]|nr:flippase-like domain-containing protein [Nanoarchaeota archaeon]